MKNFSVLWTQCVVYAVWFGWSFFLFFTLSLFLCFFCLIFVFREYPLNFESIVDVLYACQRVSCCCFFSQFIYSTRKWKKNSRAMKQMEEVKMKKVEEKWKNRRKIDWILCWRSYSSSTHTQTHSLYMSINE